MSGADSTAAIEAAFRIEFPGLVAGLTRFVGDVGLAEELAQDTLVDALVQWPTEGTPRRPGAWLMTVGKRKAIDRFRRDRNLDTNYAEIGRGGSSADARSAAPPGTHGVFEDHIDDDVLGLMFVACHPVLAVRARTALTLRLVGGLTTAEIARAYLEPEATVAQRIVRAKRSIAAAAIPFEVPEGEDRGTLDRYHLLHSVRGDLLDKLGRHSEAADAFTQAASLTQNGSERQLLSARAATSGAGADGSLEDAQGGLERGFGHDRPVAP